MANERNTGRAERERVTRLLDERLYDLDEENMPAVAARIAALEARVAALEAAATPTV